MNLDFNKPSAKMFEIAKEAKVDIKDPVVLAEFKLLQMQHLEDLRRHQMGEKPLTPQEIER